MPKINDTGIYQLKNGYWGFRYVIVVNGQRVERRRNVDENGNPLVVYHGTNADFDTFDNSVNQSKHRQVGADLGYFFTDSEKVARRFIPKKEVQENIVNYEPFANKEEYDYFSKNIMNNWQELKQNYGDDKFFELRDAYSEIANNIYKQKNQDPQAYG